MSVRITHRSLMIISITSMVFGVMALLNTLTWVQVVGVGLVVGGMFGSWLTGRLSQAIAYHREKGLIR